MIELMISNATGDGNKRDPENEVGNQSGDLSPRLILSNLTGQRGHYCRVAVASVWPENSLEIWVGVCGPLLETLTLSQSKICVFPHPIYFRPNPKSRGGGGSQQRFIRGGSAPRSKLLPFYIPFLIEKVPILYTFHRKLHPFHTPTEPAGFLYRSHSTGQNAGHHATDTE